MEYLLISTTSGGKIPSTTVNFPFVRVCAYILFPCVCPYLSSFWKKIFVFLNKPDSDSAFPSFD